MTFIDGNRDEIGHELVLSPDNVCLKVFARLHNELRRRIHYFELSFLDLLPQFGPLVEHLRGKRNCVDTKELELRDLSHSVSLKVCHEPDYPSNHLGARQRGQSPCRSSERGLGRSNFSQNLFRHVSS